MSETEQETAVKSPQQKRAEELAEKKRRSALVKSSPGLSRYGTPEELAEFVGRMRFMLHGGDKLSDAQIWALSQAAFRLGLDPITKEICWLKDGVFVQYRGVQRLGRRQLVEWYGPRGLPELDPILIETDIERQKYMIPDGALAVKIPGMIPAKRQAFVQDAKDYRKALGPEAPWEVIVKGIGEMPVTTGIGYITKEEMWDKDNPRWWHSCKVAENNTEEFNKKGGGGKYKAYVLRGQDPCPDCGRESWASVNRYPHFQCATKRARAHFFYQETDLPFAIGSGGEGMADLGAWEEEPTPVIGLDENIVDVAPSYKGHEVPESVKTSEEFEAWQNLVDETEDRKEREATEGPPPKPTRSIYPQDDEPKKSKKSKDPAKTKPLTSAPEEIVDELRTFTITLLDKLIKEKLAPDRAEAAKMLGRSPWASKSTPLNSHPRVIKWARLYRADIDQDVPFDEAALSATQLMGNML